ncbi:MAG: regulatory protein GemA [Pseudomonadota bacterium]
MSTTARARPARNGELAMIHIAAQQLGMDDSTYRDMLWTIARVRSAKDLDQAGRDQVLRHLAAVGWKDPRNASGRQPRYKKGSQPALIRHLWSRLHSAGKVQDGSDKALRSYVRSQSAAYAKSGQGWDDPNLLPRWVAGKVIEHLKQWCEREGIAR